jgi:hypothetical protein
MMDMLGDSHQPDHTSTRDGETAAVSARLADSILARSEVAAESLSRYRPSRSAPSKSDGRRNRLAGPAQKLALSTVLVSAGCVVSSALCRPIGNSLAARMEAANGAEGARQFTEDWRLKDFGGYKAWELDGNLTEAAEQQARHLTASEVASVTLWFLLAVALVGLIAWQVLQLRHMQIRDDPRNPLDHGKSVNALLVAAGICGVLNLAAVGWSIAVVTANRDLGPKNNPFDISLIAILAGVFSFLSLALLCVLAFQKVLPANVDKHQLQSAFPGAIGLTDTGEPVYPLIGYTAAGDAVTADRVRSQVVQGSDTRTNSLAIVALVVGLLAGALAIPFGHVARAQIRRTGERGAGIALAGLILGYVNLAVVVAVLITLVVAFRN